ncbi:sulfotransferase domain-containing protein [Microcoleus sp. S28C3]|uniref:sulfotransferase domain-containing protein n=1 Tax=Microcoleus sp. S28C3 TaxID=3055414 RepID=UPI002FD32FDA
MPKSGTTFIMRYQLDLINHAMPQNGVEEVQKQFPGGKFFPSIDCEKVEMLRRISAENGDCLIKTHSAPSFSIKELVDKGEVKAAFCFRDPRDTMLSAIDHGERTRKGLDSTGAFADIYTLKDAIPLAEYSIKVYYKWREYGQAIFIQYEELMSNKLGYLRDIAAYFGYKCEEDVLLAIFQKHEKIKEQARNFNKGVINRWKSEMSQEDLMFCNEIFKADLLAMGYKLL